MQMPATSYNFLPAHSCRHSSDHRARFLTGVQMRGAKLSCKRHAWLEIHRPVKRVASGGQTAVMTRMVRRSGPLFAGRQSACRARLAKPLRLPPSHCLAICTYEPWEPFAKASRGWWRMEGDSFVGLLAFYGDMVQWPVAGRAHVLQAPHQWHLTLPSNRHRIVFFWSSAPKSWERSQRSSPESPQLPWKTREWLRMGPAAFHCNASGFHPEWSDFRHRLQVWARKVDLEPWARFGETILFVMAHPI